MIDLGRRLDTVRRELNLTNYDLWLAYMGIGGRQDAFALRAYMEGSAPTTDIDHDHIVHALNETYMDLGGDHPLPYIRP